IAGNQRPPLTAAVLLFALGTRLVFGETCLGFGFRFFRCILDPRIGACLEHCRAQAARAMGIGEALNEAHGPASSGGDIAIRTKIRARSVVSSASSNWDLHTPSTVVKGSRQWFPAVPQ